MEDCVHTIENFFGVYLLYCVNPKYLGRTYIGYTVDPNRRLKQHNKGRQAGGAYRTSNKGPWEMVLIIHGFPNDITALRFEWAWQHPDTSRRLQHVTKKKAREKVYDFRIRVLSEMLSVGPWNRLPLVIRWLNQKFCREFTSLRTPPLHMSICYGPVISKKASKSSEVSKSEVKFCDVCFKILQEEYLSCLNIECSMKSHIVCLAKVFLSPGEYIPIDGECPKCFKSCLWGDLIKKMKGCYNNLDITIDCTVDDFSYDSE